MENYKDGKRQLVLDFVLTKKQAMQYIFLSCIQMFQMFLLGKMFHKVLLSSTAINNLFVTPCAPHITTFVNHHAIVRQKIIIAIFLGQL